MCRHLAYIGPAVTLRSLMLDPPCSLRRQSTDPRHQKPGRTNLHGFGVGWYDETGALQRYRTTTPIGDDAPFVEVAGATSSGAILASVRDGSPGFAIEVTSNAPFTDGRWLFSHNGTVWNFREGIGNELRAMMSPKRRDAIEGEVDSEAVFALVMTRIDAGDTPEQALGWVVHRVKELGGGKLNFLLTDGRGITATTWGNSLFTRNDDGAVTVASEPHDDEPGWDAVPDLFLVHAAEGRIALDPL